MRKSRLAEGEGYTSPLLACSKFLCLELPDFDMMYMAYRTCEVSPCHATYFHIWENFGSGLLLAAIVICVCTALSVRADERPSKPSGTSVAKRARRS